jgi:protein tyrosine phosphatase (PTP) superfamily phosphohydrolase (DUF442 family)
VVAPDPLSALYHYRRISNRIATAGQPTSDQFPAIAAEGFEIVINLGLKDADYALPNEQALVESLGLIYESIPVVWQEPTQQILSELKESWTPNEVWQSFINQSLERRGINVED